MAVHDYREQRKKSILGTIAAKTGPLSYEVETSSCHTTRVVIIFYLLAKQLRRLFKILLRNNSMIGVVPCLMSRVTLECQ